MATIVLVDYLNLKTLWKKLEREVDDAFKMVSRLLDWEAQHKERKAN